MLYAGKPAIRAARVGEICLELFVLGQIAAPDEPGAPPRIQVACLQFVVQAAFLNEARRIEKVVLGCQVQIEGHGDVEAAAAVVAGGGEEQKPVRRRSSMGKLSQGV